MKIVKDYNEGDTLEVIEVTAANYMADYVISITFSDGSSQDVDFKPFLSKAIHPSILKYLDISLFKQFRVVNGNLNWNDYDLIFPIHDLHDSVIK
jgi:hypothetical protein